MLGKDNVIANVDIVLRVCGRSRQNEAHRYGKNALRDVHFMPLI